MRTATATPDDHDDRPAVLFARLREPLDDEHRRIKYDDPLVSKIRERGIGASVRGFSEADQDGHIHWVGVEVTLDAMRDVVFVAECLAQLGAPPDTLIEIETENSCIEFALDQPTGQ